MTNLKYFNPQMELLKCLNSNSIFVAFAQLEFSLKNVKISSWKTLCIGLNINRNVKYFQVWSEWLISIVMDCGWTAPMKQCCLHKISFFFFTSEGPDHIFLCYFKCDTIRYIQEIFQSCSSFSQMSKCMETINVSTPLNVNLASMSVWTSMSSVLSSHQPSQCSHHALLCWTPLCLWAHEQLRTDWARMDFLQQRGYAKEEAHWSEVGGKAIIICIHTQGCKVFLWDLQVILSNVPGLF